MGCGPIFGAKNEFLGAHVGAGSKIDFGALKVSSGPRQSQFIQDQSFQIKIK